MKKPTILGTCIYKETGKKHSFKGMLCEDSVAKFYAKETGVTAVALSDGAGSCEHALVGSSLVSETAAGLLSDKFEKLWALDNLTAAECIICEVCRPLSKASEANNWAMESMYATLLCVAVHPDGRYLAFHVGDGVIVGYSPKKGCHILSQYEHEYASNIATFVNVPGTDYKLLKGKREYSSFLLSSDGAEPYLVPPGIVTAPILMLQQAAFVLSDTEMEEYMSSLVNKLKKDCHADDDISFALLSDYRDTEAVFFDMTHQFLCGLMDIPDMPAKRSKQKEYIKIIQELHYYPEGMSYMELCRKLYLRKKSRLLKRMSRMFPGEFLKCEKGWIYLG